MIKQVYVAAPYPMREHALAFRSLLHDIGVGVTSRWLDSDQDTDRESAEADFADIRAAQALVLLNPAQWANEGTGGRHTEVGYALALGMIVFVFGQASNIFHQLVVVVRTFEELRAALVEINPSAYGRIMTHGEMIQAMCRRVHVANKRWWIDLQTGQPLTRNVGELLMLTVSELAEAMEGHRKNLPDDKLPRRRMFDVELADAIIRIFDIAGGFNLDLGGAFEEKMDFNATRVDHTDAHRLSEHGKKY